AQEQSGPASKAGVICGAGRLGHEEYEKARTALGVDEPHPSADRTVQVAEPAADSDAAVLASFAGIAQTVEPQPRQLLHCLFRGLGHRNDCWIGWLKGLSWLVIGSGSAEAIDHLSERGQFFVDFGRQRLERHVGSFKRMLGSRLRL